MTTRADPYIGRSFGNYQLTRKIGEGGMGSVYLGEHPLIGKRVALKLLHADLLADEEMISRFFTEARSVCQIGHQNIVDILDFGKDEDGSTYFIMEYLEGEPLGETLEREGSLEVERAVRIAVQTASALAASHQHGIVHRDLKPENIFLTRRPSNEEFVKVLDFGIAKLTGDADGISSHRTRVGVILGTPHYMSPEQCEGAGHIDRRADIYSLGIILYEMVAGKVPFDGKEMAQIMVKHLTADPVPLTSVRPDCPKELETIISRCLRKDPNMRFGNMGEVVAALEALGLYGTIPATDSGHHALPESGHVAVDTVREQEPKTVMLMAEKDSQRFAAGVQPPVPTTSEQSELKTMMLVDGPSAGPSSAVAPGTAMEDFAEDEAPTTIMGDGDDDQAEIEEVRTLLLDPDAPHPAAMPAAVPAPAPAGAEDLRTMLLDSEPPPATGSEAQTLLLDSEARAVHFQQPPPGAASGPTDFVPASPAAGGGGALGAIIGALVGVVILAVGGVAYYMGYLPDLFDLRVGAHAETRADDDEDEDEDRDRDRDKDKAKAKDRDKDKDEDDDKAGKDKGDAEDDEDDAKDDKAGADAKPATAAPKTAAAKDSPKTAAAKDRPKKTAKPAAAAPKKLKAPRTAKAKATAAPGTAKKKKKKEKEPDGLLSPF